nr:MAG TPA: hypothetical protein [Caudoviricetes sp.]
MLWLLNSSVRGYLSSVGILLWIKRNRVLDAHSERIVDLQCRRHKRHISLVVPIVVLLGYQGYMTCCLS